MKQLRAKLSRQGGFTLIEMLLVVAIISILVAISIPVVNMNLEKARDATDKANERAARTLATMVYMGEIDPLELEGCTLDGYVVGTEITTGWDAAGLYEAGLFYDAESGTLTFKKPLNKGYGQCTGCGEIGNKGETHVDHVILIEMDKNGVFTPHWVPDQDLEGGI